MRACLAGSWMLIAAACSDGGGGSSSGAQARFVYVATAQSIATMRVDAAGTLHPMGVARSPVGIHDLAVHPNGRFVYAAGGNGADVQVFRGNGHDGLLEFVGAPNGIPEGGRSIDLAMHPSGRFLVALFTREQDTEYLASYRIDAGTGALQQVGERRLAGVYPIDLAFDVWGRHLYVTEQGTALRTAFAVDEATGELGESQSASSLRAPASQGTVGPFEVRGSTQREWTWAADRTRDELRTYGSDMTNGMLVELGPALPLDLDQGWAQLPHSMVASPTGPFVWVGDHVQILVLALDRFGLPTIVDRTNVWSHVGYLATDGTRLFAGGTAAGGTWLGSYQGVVFGTTTLPGFLAGDESDHLGNHRIDRSTGRLEWAADHRLGGNISALALAMGQPVVATARLLLTADAGGSALTRSAIDAATGTVSAAVSVPTAPGPTALAATPNGRFVFVGHHNGGDVVTGSVDLEAGTVTPTATTSGPGGLVALAAEPSGRFLFAVGDTPARIATLAIGSDGSTTVAATRSLSLVPVALTANPSGDVAVVLGADGSLEVLVIDDSTGASWPSSYTTAGSSGGALAIDPSGQHVYVTSPAEGVVRAFRLARQTTGFPPNTAEQLFAIGPPAATGSDPVGIVVHPNGGFVYVANAGSDDVSVFRRDPSTGVLTGVGQRVPAGTDPDAMAITADGSFLLVANRGSDDVTTLAIDAATGALVGVGQEFRVGSGPADMLLLTQYR